MEKKITKNLLRVFFIILTVGSLWYWNEVMSVKDYHGVAQTKALYYQKRNTIDVIMMGSSHVHCDIDTGLLWKDFGIAAYDYSAAEQPLWITYYYLQELCKYQKPKVMVLDLFSSALRKADYQYDWIRPNINGLRFSLNKLNMLAVSVEPEKIEEYFPDFAFYHDRFSELEDEDFNYPLEHADEFKVFKGFTPYFNVEPQIKPVLDQKKSTDLTLKQEIYLQKIIDYTKAHDIKLYLIVAPYVTNSDDEKVYNKVKKIAKNNEIDFHDFNYDYDEMGLDFSRDFNDYSHVNYRGAVKFTKYLGNNLKASYDIPDRRGDSLYDSWEDEYKRVKKLVKKEKFEMP